MASCIKMSVQIFRHKLVKSYKPWICRKLVKFLVFGVILLCVKLTAGSSNFHNDPSVHHSSTNVRTPRSINEKFRVFKYITEDQVVNSKIETTTESKNAPNSFANKTTDPEVLLEPNESTATWSKPTVPTLKKKQKLKRNKGAIVNKVENGNAVKQTRYEVDPVLKTRALSVTDRSLIPNSFFMQSDSQIRNVERLQVHPVKNHHNNNHSDNLNVLQKPTHQQNGNHDIVVTDGSSSSSAFGTSMQTINNRNKDGNNNKRLSQNRNLKSGDGTSVANKSYKTQDPNLEKEKTNSTTNDVILSINATLLSERSRRSPFGRNRNNNAGGHNMMYQNHMPIMHQNVHRRILNRTPQKRGSNSGNHHLVRKTTVQRGGNKQQSRAPLYNRNNQNGFPVVTNVQMPQQYQYMQNVQFGNNNGRFKQLSPAMVHNMNRGVAVVMPPPQQSQQKLDPILPSPSSDFAQYQQQAILEEPTWNHPMYRRYAKVAKNVQNKMSGLIRRPTSGKGRIRPDFSKIPAIPLPRPGGNSQGRGVRSRPQGGVHQHLPPPPEQGRYSYPKSAQSIQDILNHFQRDNKNDIINDVDGPGPKGMGSRYPTGKPRYNNGHNNKNRQRDEGPVAIADLSSELKDVRFSLLRDIREFAKRPMGDGTDSDPGPADEPPPERHKRPPVKLRSPYSQKPPRNGNHRRDDRDHEEEEDLPWRKPNTKHVSERDDPFSPEYNHESGFDEIFHPQPKPVRELTYKKSSRFRLPNPDRERNDELSREKEYHHPNDNHYSRKKERPSSPSDRDRFTDDSRYDRDSERESPPPKHSSSSRYDGAIDEIDSTERSYKEPSQPSILARGPSSPFSSSVEIEIERKQQERPVGDRDSDRDRYRDRSRGTNRNRDRGNGMDDGDRSYLSSFESERIRRPPHHSEQGRRREREKDRDYPKSIHDKLRDIHEPFSSIEYPPPHLPPLFPKPPPYDYDSDTRLEHKFPSPFIENKPIVIKRPFESPLPYQTVQEMNNKKMQNHEFWNNYASATEKNLYGYTNPSSLNMNVVSSLSPPPFSPHGGGYIVQATPTLPTATLNPFYMTGRGSANGGGGSSGVFSPPSDQHEDILEIHTGSRQPTSGLSPNIMGSYGHGADNSMQKAYLELLQQKMHSEASLLNNQQPLPKPPMSTTTRKTPTPMRMKIHIYPNDQSEAVAINQNQYQSGNGSPSGYYNGGGSSSYSSNTVPVPLLSPSYPQKVGGALNGYANNGNVLHLSGPGPAPSIHSRTSSITNNHSNNDNKDSSSGDKNKNLVLHLHVHRRNDVGPAELDAESSDHFMSTDKPINYKEIYEDSPNNHQNDNISNHASANNGGGDPDVGDKSVSMEVPIHDDKIENVLHTLLQLRDRNASRKRRRRRK